MNYKSFDNIILKWCCCLIILFTCIFKSDGVYIKEPTYSCPSRKNIIYPCNCTAGSDDGLYIHCDNVNLATLSIALENLASSKLPIVHLTITRGQFARLFGPVFANVTARILTIENTPIHTIDENSFFGINITLEEIHLLKTNLSSITPQSFGILGKLTTLEIDGHALEKLDKDLFVDQEISNRLEEIRLVNGRLNDIPIETFQPLRKLKILDLHGNRLENFKRNQFKNLRNVEVLDISHNALKKLEAQHIADLTKLGWCNVSHNALTELLRGTFARTSVLKVLNLSHNRIARLDANSVRGMRFLRRLYLSDNRISDIGRGTFGSVARIGTIDLARNALKKIEFQMFSQLNYVEILNLAENNITLIEKNSFKDIYQASINISHNMLEKIETNAFENCVNITVLDLSFNRLSNFSRSAFDVNTFATVFQLSYNFITSLAQIPLQNMTGLRVLNASHNNITEIPKNTFPKLYELHTIDISHNNISTIFNGVFQTLFSLRSLDLSHNNLQEIKSSMFGTLPTLIEMNLSHNGLTSIVRGALAKLTSLRELDLSYNRLEKLFQIPISLNKLLMNNNRIDDLPAGTWPVMNSLLYMDLSDNRIGDNLTGESFRGLLVLQRLLLERNNITRPPAESLASMTTLQYLELGENNITALGKNAFGKLPVLFELNLHGNGVVDISKRAFEGLLQLITLNLSANGMNHIPNEAFVGLPSLRKLDLSHNNLTKLDNKTNGVLDDLLSLENLNLSHNRISFVTKKTFPSNQYIPYNLKYLDLSYNQMPVLTYDITFGTKKLLELNVSHNHINELRRGILSNFTALQLIDLSFNELSNLASEPNIFDLPRNLTKLHLQNNHIYRIPSEQFDKGQQFDIIDMRNNNLTEVPQVFIKILRNGSNVLLSNNPINCDCTVRPLKRFLLEQTHPDEDLLQIVCAEPKNLFGESLHGVIDESLQCPTDDRDLLGKGSEEFGEVTDIKFRDIQWLQQHLSVRWFVTSRNDIGWFTLYIRNRENAILWHTEVLYNVRKVDISQKDLQIDMATIENTEICVVIKNSDGNTGQWFAEQCQKVPRYKGTRRNIFFGNNAIYNYPNATFLLIISCIVACFNRYSFVI